MDISISLIESIVGRGNENFDQIMNPRCRKMWLNQCWLENHSMVLTDDDDLHKVGGNCNVDDALARMMFHIFLQLFLSGYDCVCGRIFCVNLFLLCRGSARTRRLAAAKLCWNKSKLLISPQAIVMLDHDHPSPSQAPQPACFCFNIHGSWGT